MNQTNQFFKKLKAQAEENPLLALAATAALLTAVGKVMDANTARSAAKTHALEVNRRIMNAGR